MTKKIIMFFCKYLLTLLTYSFLHNGSILRHLYAAKQIFLSLFTLVRKQKSFNIIWLYDRVVQKAT